MKNLRKRVLAGELLFGSFLNLGSSLSAEIIGTAGFGMVRPQAFSSAARKVLAVTSTSAIASSAAAPTAVC